MATKAAAAIAGSLDLSRLTLKRSAEADTGDRPYCDLNLHNGGSNLHIRGMFAHKFKKISISDRIG